jgi:ribosomal protein S18 acetylase RimI-like enzyme
LNKIIYRKAKVSDMDGLIDLWNNLMQYHLNYFPDFYKFKKNHISLMKKHFKKNIVSKKSLVFVAEESEKLIGYVMISVGKFRPYIYLWKKEARLDDLFVDEKYRGKGVAKKLFNIAKKFAKENNVDYLKFNVDVKNERANNFYDKFGALEFRTIRLVKIK